MTTDAPARTGHILVVDDDVMIRELIRLGLEHYGLHVTTAESGADAVRILDRTDVNLVISDIMMPNMDGFGLISKLRTTPHTRNIPVIFLTSRIDPTDSASGLRLSAEDFIRKPFDIGELATRVTDMLSRSAEPVDHFLSDAEATILPTAAFCDVTRHAQAQSKRVMAVASIDIDEYPALRARFGDTADRDLGARISLLLAANNKAIAVGRDDHRIVVLLEDKSESSVRKDLAHMAKALSDERLYVAGERVTITPSVGWAMLEPKDHDVERAVARAGLAAYTASAHLDLQPVPWEPRLEETAPPPRTLRRWRKIMNSTRTAWQIGATFAVGIGLPLALYSLLHYWGYDLISWFYAGIVAALVITGLSIWIEGFNALDPERPPREPSRPPPPATAIIAAYLPNEAATILSTIEAFLRVDYPNLQVIVAYNTPRGYHVERTMREIASRDPRLLPLRVPGSTSKAQNVNAALRHTSGEFVGVFDADHQPDPGSFHRAWRWLSNGWDVVQGHCVIRNGDASRVARTIAVEFEAIYAVSHPGRNRLHGFGVFGGSNGYWRTDLLRATRMHGFMLTEDIDSSLRVVRNGGKIANDPALLSRELAPTTVGQLWNQRIRWAQGWHQVSRKHLFSAWRSSHLRLRQKLGMTFLLGWREIYPWISIQMLPLIGFLAWREGGLGELSWIIALFVLTTLFTFSVGPGQVIFSHRLAVPEIRRRKAWFWHYLWVSSLLYTEWKNIITRVAQFKELTGERQWKVTPRTAPSKGTRP